MSDLAIIGWSAIAATFTWGLAVRRAAATIARLRADMNREVLHWQAAAGRARTRAIQLERELARWSEGCRQGREDVVSILPMLMAAQDHAPCLCQTGTEGNPQVAGLGAARERGGYGPQL